MIFIRKVSIFIILSMALTCCSEQGSSAKNKNSVQVFRISEGLEVSLIAPQGFNITKEHYGFAQVESFSRIRIEEKEQAFIPFTKTITKENLLKNKYQLLKQEQVDIRGALCNLYTLRQNIAGSYFEKLWLIAGDNLSSILVEASYPEGSNPTHKAAIRNSLLTLNVATDKIKRIYTGLPFILTDTPGFKIKQRFANSILLVPNADQQATNETDQKQTSETLVISHGVTKQSIEQVQTLSEYFLNNSKHFRNVDIYQNEMIKINEIPALASMVNVEVKDSPVVIYQILSYQKDRFLLVQAQSTIDQSAQFKAKVDLLLKHFEFR